MTRAKAEEILVKQQVDGAFLVRDSESTPGIEKKLMLLKLIENNLIGINSHSVKWLTCTSHLAER